MKNSVLILILAVCLFSCNSEAGKPVENAVAGKKENSANTVKVIGLPFAGKREFETRPGVSGTGTPHKAIEIMKNGDVYFSFEQQNQGDGTITKERYYAGKYRQYMKCLFKKWDNEITRYELSNDTIYEVDSNNKRIENEECCGMGDAADGKKCVCKGELSAVEQ